MERKMKRTLSNFLAGGLYKQAESTEQIAEVAFKDQFMGHTIMLAQNVRHNLRPLCMKQVEQLNYKPK